MKNNIFSKDYGLGKSTIIDLLNSFYYINLEKYL